MTKLDALVDDLIEQDIKKHKKLLNGSLIKPISEDYPFASNGLYFFCGKMGTGKTYQVCRHIMMTERMFPKPYYDNVIWTSTSDGMDNTVESLKGSIQTPIQFVKDTNLITFLNKHLRQKEKFNALNRLVNSKFKDVNKKMKEIAVKHGLYKDGRNEKFELRRVVAYITEKMTKYPFRQYPSYTLLVMDDFAGHPLVKNETSPLNIMFTKTRHYHLTGILITQSWRFIHFNFKRLCTDIVVYKGFSQKDFKTMIEQTPNNQEWEELWEKYKNLPSEHSSMRLHITAGLVLFDEQ